MVICGKCGTQLAAGVAFCPQCGAPVGAAAVPPPSSSAPPPGGWTPTPVVGAAPGTGLQENVAGLLCYLLGWLTGIIFLLIDKRPFVRFHAAQSIVVFGALNVLRLLFVFGWFGFHAMFALISLLISLVSFIAWIVLMVFAYKGKWYEVPVAAGIAKNIAGSVSV